MPFATRAFYALEKPLPASCVPAPVSLYDAVSFAAIAPTPFLPPTRPLPGECVLSPADNGREIGPPTCMLLSLLSAPPTMYPLRAIFLVHPGGAGTRKPPSTPIPSLSFANPTINPPYPSRRFDLVVVRSTTAIGATAVVGVSRPQTCPTHVSVPGKRDDVPSCC
jgi:hypothetical protein